jgi:hypothetical protein
MTFKTKLFRSAIITTITMAGALQCTSDPASSGWGADGKVTMRNNYSSIRSVVQDSRGRFYALSYGRMLTFEEQDFRLNEPPDTLPLPDGARNIALDAKNSLLVCYYDAVRLAEPIGDGFSISDIDTTLTGFRIVNVDDKIIRATTDSGEILSWDGSSLINHGTLPIVSGGDIRGIFADRSGISVFVSCGMEILRYVIIDSGVMKYTLTADSCVLYSIFKVGEKLFADGYLCAGANSGCHSIRFEIKPDNSIDVFDTLTSGYNEYAQGPDAVYLLEHEKVIKITAGACYHASINDNVTGPLYINRSGRAALMYLPTRRIFPVDSLGLYEFKRW